jgi:hypothetical protein
MVKPSVLPRGHIFAIYEARRYEGFITTHADISVDKLHKPLF